MEKIGTLIQKLQEQHQAGVDAQFLLHTAEMLVAELGVHHHQQQVKKRVAVLMPQHFAVAELIVERVEEIVPELAPSTQKINIETSVLKEDVIAAIDSFIEPTPKPILQKPTSIFSTEVLPPKIEGEKMLFELNDVLVEEEQQEINDKHQQQHVEVAATIKQPAVKDLRKAIGVNDKYAFIQYLFKGDEATYERCIKTINGFNVFPEAEAWIKRELITKMGWIEDEETVQTFLYLVKRRFA